MYYLVDRNNKIIFGWSAKCGCSHIKNIYLYLTNNLTPSQSLHKNDKNTLPDDILNYTTLIISRNPYKRLVSGFLDKYKKHGEFRHLWKDPSLTFTKFVNKLVNCDWTILNKHHFTPQTTEHFDKKIFLSKIIKFYDISNIDYEYIEKLYNKTIPQDVLDKKQGHERSSQIKINETYDKCVYDLNIDEYIDYNVDIKYFYNEEIKEKVFNFYIKDFNFFNSVGIDYIKTDF